MDEFRGMSIETLKQMRTAAHELWCEENEKAERAYRVYLAAQASPKTHTLHEAQEAYSDYQTAQVKAEAYYEKYSRLDNALKYAEHANWEKLRDALVPILSIKQIISDPEWQLRWKQLQKMLDEIRDSYDYVFAEDYVLGVLPLIAEWFGIKQ